MWNLSFRWKVLCETDLAFEYTAWSTAVTVVADAKQKITIRHIEVPSNLWYEHNKSQILNVSRLVLEFSLPNPLKPIVKSRMEIKMEQRRQAQLQLHQSDQQFYYLRVCVLY